MKERETCRPLTESSLGSIVHNGPLVGANHGPQRDANRTFGRRDTCNARLPERAR